MKTMTIRFDAKYAESVGKMLHSLGIKIIMNWSEDELTETTIFCVLRINEENESIPGSLQVEKIREQRIIKIVKA